jgi:hypothetical protein
VPVQSIERKLAAIFAADIAGYCGSSGFLDSGRLNKWHRTGRAETSRSEVPLS